MFCIPHLMWNSIDRSSAAYIRVQDNDGKGPDQPSEHSGNNAYKKTGMEQSVLQYHGYYTYMSVLAKGVRYSP